MSITPVHNFIARWQGVTGAERANYQLFVHELCVLLGVPTPDPAQDDTRDNAYVFERRVTFAHGDGSSSAGFIDCYRRGAFVLEAKKVRAGPHTKGFDDALLRARAQAEGYARALPATEGRPPFVVVVDVGHVIELYAEFTRSGATYTPFPDPRSHRIKLADLANDAVRERLRDIWLDPLTLDPARASAKVTRKVAQELADVARSLEAAGNKPQHVAGFLTRCLFSMFAEDVELLPANSFKGLLEKHRDAPATLAHMLKALWTEMDRGGFSAALATNVLRFNGKLFKGGAEDGYVLTLNRDQIDGLLRAAAADWKEVEPAIFGTLLERALHPDERHALGAHYTPRAYVERLVLPTVVEPLRADWANTQAAALLLSQEANALEGKAQRDKLEEARVEVRRFHHQLCTTRVLDPACGSGNFLYVTLEHLKRLEGEVLNQLHDLGETQDKLALEGETVTPQQLLGLELNERAAALAELVLWIGYLQWHIRTRGNASVAEPVVHDYGNIQHRDAVLAYSGQEPMRSDAGELVTRWDGKTTKPHPVTGEPVPDEAAQVPQWRYLEPRAATWPAADFIVGNPPFIGARTIRLALGDGYLQAVRSVHPNVPDNADFVMYWWDHAAELLARNETRRFGFITTNSITQSFSRRVIDQHLATNSALTIRFAIPDHPWVDSSDGAAIRIAMTVVDNTAGNGQLLLAQHEQPAENGEIAVEFDRKEGHISSALRIGANVQAALPLKANDGLCCVGYQLTGQGFVVDADQATSLSSGFGQPGSRIRPLLTGRDVTQAPRGLFAIDLYGLAEDGLRAQHPQLYQWVLDRVKPERDQNPRASLKERWWIFGEARSTFRPALKGTTRLVVASLTAKHRVFQFAPAQTICDSTTVMFALEDALHFGVLSSAVHVEWALAAGGTLEDRPRYNKSGCFDPFPFPDADTGLTPDLTARIRALAEQIDAHRKQRQAAEGSVTLTGLYNVLEALRAGRPLTAKEKALHDAGLVGVLKSLHDELNAAVLAAYGWADLAALVNQPPASPAHEAARETLLERLVALNAQRAAEEAQGHVRWLRPAYQDPAQATQATQTSIDMPEAPSAEEAEATEGKTKPGKKGKQPGTAADATPATRAPWPATLPEQMRAVAATLARSTAALDEATLAAHFTGRGPWKKRLPDILQTLEALGRARRVGAQWRAG